MTAVQDLAVTSLLLPVRQNDNDTGELLIEKVHRYLDEFNSSKSYGTEMFSKNGTKEGLYGTQKGERDAANKNMVGSQVLRSIYQSNSRFKKVLAPGATREMDEVKKRVLNDEYNTHYLEPFGKRLRPRPVKW